MWDVDVWWRELHHHGGHILMCSQVLTVSHYFDTLLHHHVVITGDCFGLSFSVGGMGVSTVWTNSAENRPCCMVPLGPYRWRVQKLLQPLLRSRRPYIRLDQTRWMIVREVFRAQLLYNPPQNSNININLLFHEVH